MSETAASSGGAGWPVVGEEWFFDHYRDAAEQIVEFCETAGVALEGRRIADVGAGDGIIDLGLVDRARPRELVGFDIRPTDRDVLLARAAHFGVAERLPPQLVFQRSEPTRLPAPDASFDVVVTWSAFEHIAEPLPLLHEIRRILPEEGVLFLQLWPFYYSERGSHLWEWFPEPFHHLIEPPERVVERLRAAHSGDVWVDYMATEFSELNRLTLDELGRMLLEAGLHVRKLELLSHAVHIPPEAALHPLSALGVAGVKLLATPGPPVAPPRRPRWPRG